MTGKRFLPCAPPTMGSVRSTGGRRGRLFPPGTSLPSVTSCVQMMDGGPSFRTSFPDVHSMLRFDQPTYVQRLRDVRSSKGSPPA